MLQQTQVKTVIPYFGRWIARWPDSESLAAASIDEVLQQWAGLGYYRRARSLHACAQHIASFGWPSDYAQLKALPGVGDYTAAAISSLVWNEPIPVVDGNVERVFARVMGCFDTGSSLKRKARSWSDTHMPRQQAGAWNEALMELGALVCKPVAPQCSVCPIQARCVARASELQSELPVPASKPETVKLNWTVLVMQWEGKFAVRQVKPGNWFAGMWEFHRLEGAVSEAELSAFAAGEWRVLKAFTHSVTHHRIRVQPMVGRVAKPSSDFNWVTWDELQSLAMPALQRKIARLLSQGSEV